MTTATPTPSPDALPIPEGAKHTPGPLRATGCYIVDADDEDVGEVTFIHDPERADAMARLWAASPDLLTAAQAFVAPYAALGDDDLRLIANSTGGAHELSTHAAASMLAFRAAIRAAQTGER